MLNAQSLLERIQRNVGIPWQSSKADGNADGILVGNPETEVTGVVTTFTPSLDTLRRAVAAGHNTIICRESPFFSRGERAPAHYREGAAPALALLEKDAVYQAKTHYIAANKLVIIRLVENWDARPSDGQLKGLTHALGWDAFHRPSKRHTESFDPRNVIFELPRVTLSGLARNLKARLSNPTIRVIGEPDAALSTVALLHGLALVKNVERVRQEAPVDAIVAGDAVEWEVAPYMQDLVTSRLAVGLILIGSEVSEEPGCGEMATWLKSFVTEIPVSWMPSGQPFRKLA
jgi:putative NIF3 family GTP cyclohydrolase 1 type 2